MSGGFGFGLPPPVTQQRQNHTGVWPSIYPYAKNPLERTHTYEQMIDNAGKTTMAVAVVACAVLARVCIPIVIDGIYAYATGGAATYGMTTLATGGIIIIGGKNILSKSAGTQAARLATGTTRPVGSGPAPGILEASSRLKTLAALRGYSPKGSVEYVFDPSTGAFAVGRPAASAGLRGSPHEKLTQSIGADPSTVVGGTLTRSGNGVFITTENSGHYWQNWTPAVREQFVDTMRGYGLDVVH